MALSLEKEKDRETDIQARMKSVEPSRTKDIST